MAHEFFSQQRAIIVSCGLVGALLLGVGWLSAPHAALAAGTDYYINNQSGSNCSNAAGSAHSQSQPWCDFTNVATTTFGAGDHIWLARGATWNQQLTLQGTGSSAAPIVVDAYGSGARPQIRMSDNAADIAVYMANPDWWTINNLEVSHANAGIVAMYTSLLHQGLTFTNIYAHDLTRTFNGSSGNASLPDMRYSVGIYIHSGSSIPTPTGSQYVVSGITIANYEATNDGLGFDITQGGSIGATFPSNSTQNVLIKNSYIHQTKGASLLANSSNSTVLDTRMDDAANTYQSVGTTGLWLWETSHVTVVNSLLTNVANTSSYDQTGMDLEAYDDSTHVWGNYIAGNAGAGIEILQLYRQGDFNTNHDFAGNAFSGNSASNSSSGAITRNQTTGNASGTIHDNLYNDPAGIANGDFSGFTLTNNIAVSAANLYNAPNGYSGTQGAQQWSYQTSNDGSAWSNLSYDSASGQWGGTTAPFLSAFDQAPGACAGCAVARAWTAPASGTIQIRGRVLKNDTGGGDGVRACITKNGQVIWPQSGGAQTIGYNDQVGYDTTVNDLSVTAGDVIRFAVDNGGNGNNANDLVSWTPSLGYSVVTSIVNDTNAGIHYSGNGGSDWVYSPSRGFGDYNNDEHWTTTNGATLSYAFTGTTIGFITEKTPASGSYSIQIDGGTAVTVNTYNATRIARQLAFLQTQLANGPHTITITVHVTSGQYGEIDAFTTTPPVNDTALSYTGSWVYSPNRGFGDYQDDEHWTRTNGDVVSYSFVGTGVVFITETTPYSGNYSVTLDNGTPVTVNTYTATRIAQQLVWQNATPLSDGSHTITITKTSGSYGEIDALAILP